MSLIERAVSRLAAAPQTQSGAADGDQTSVSDFSERKTTIERLADRLAESPDLRATLRQSVMGEPEPGASHDQSNAVGTTTPAAPVQASDPSGRAGEQVHINLDAFRARGMVVPNGPATPTAHEFRVIKRPLLNNAFGRSGQEAARNGRRIMVTSAFPGEGKTLCSISLAMSIAAERDHMVILVDADVARPSVLHELGIQEKPGLMDWLVVEEQDLSRLVLHTNVDRLALLPAGRRHEHATELLASEAMGRLLDRLSALYPDCVFIFDSPPLLVTTEARVLASYMGQVVMVVEAGKTPRDAVTQALSTIKSNEIIGLVLNKASGIETSGYSQGYGYGST